MAKTKVPEVVICINGGVLVSVYSTTPIKVVNADQDNWDAEGLTSKQRDARFKCLTRGMEAIY